MVELEAIACLQVVQFILEIGLTQVVFEGDLAVVSSALVHGTREFADIRTQASIFQYVDFIHVNRSCNSVAVAPAKKVKSALGL